MALVRGSERTPSHPGLVSLSGERVGPSTHCPDLSARLILLTAPNLPNLPRTFALFLAIPSLLASAALSLDPSQVQTPLPKLLLALPPTILAIAALVSPLRMEERAVWIAPLVVMSLARYLEKAAGDMVAEAGGLQGLVYSSPSA